MRCISYIFLTFRRIITPTDSPVPKLTLRSQRLVPKSRRIAKGDKCQRRDSRSQSLISQNYVGNLQLSLDFILINHYPAPYAEFKHRENLDKA